MILQALKEYYDRKPDLPRFGFEEKEIPYILTLKVDGTPINLSPTYDGEGRKRRARKFSVPQAVKKSVNIASNLLWGNPEYALGVAVKGKPDKVTLRHEAFKRRVVELNDCHDEGVEAIRQFLAREDKIALLENFGENWKELLKTGSNLTFQLAGDTVPVVERPAVKVAMSALPSGSNNVPSVCLITGANEPIERLHSSIKGVWGAQSSGANIVSFNLDAFKSFGKDQGANAPVGETAAFAYTTALNHLLRKGSKQRIQVGDASAVFWAEKTTNFEEQVVDFFGEPPKDDPDRGVRAVESLFKSVQSGTSFADESKQRFYVLGLAPNASRIAIRFWIVDTVSNMAGKICQHFDDMRIVHGPKDKDVLSLFRLLVSTAAQGKSENIPPNLGGDVMRSILEGLPYPQTLLQAAIRRVRAEQSKKDKRTGKALSNVTYERAALIKACLNRAIRYQNPNIKEELKMSLDTCNTNIGYRLGRLFATLEKIQIRKFTQTGGKEPNSTIRDKYYGAASGTPVTVFGTLIRLSKHHLASLENVGERIKFERLFGDIMDGIKDFPSHLNLADQGRFAIGYYHQMQDFYTKKTV